MALSILIIGGTSTAYHIYYRDWIYQAYLYKLRKNYFKNLELAKKRKQLRDNRRQRKLDNLDDDDSQDSSMESGDERNLSQIEEHDFRPKTPEE